MADAALERWRERCRTAAKSELPRGIDSLNSELAIVSGAQNTTHAEISLIRYGGLLGIPKQQKRRIRLALRWLREEMERGDD